jgi:hypothetical protein
MEVMRRERTDGSAPIPVMADAMATILGERFTDRLDDEGALAEAYERHNAAVRAAVPSDRLVEWQPADGWGPLCDALGVDEPDEPFPVTNTREQFRAMLGLG